MTSIFSKFQFPRDPEPEIAYEPCKYSICDGSGLMEVEATWFGGMRMVNCQCRKDRD